jgi:hypothetical protein
VAVCLIALVLGSLLAYPYPTVRDHYTDHCATYRDADRSLARPTSRCILFDGSSISFDASLVIYINITNIPPIMIISRIYEHQNLTVSVDCFLPGWANALSAPLYIPVV